jgi:hypothetical protein
MIRAFLLVWLTISLAACALPHVLPKSLEAEMEVNKDLVPVGGRIVTTTQQDGVLVVVEKLPLLHDDPTQGPDDKAPAEGWFMFSLKGNIEELGRKPGNKLVVVGKWEGTQVAEVGSLKRDVPYLVARCVHIYKTGREKISEFPHLTDGYYPLPRETYCARK